MRHYLHILTTALMLCIFTAVNAQTTMYGFYRNYGNGGLVTFDKNEPAKAKLVKKTNIFANSGAFAGDTMYVLEMDDNDNTLIYTVDTITGTATLWKNAGRNAPIPMDMSYDYTTETMLAVSNSSYYDGVSALHAMNLTTGTFTVLQENLGVFVRSIAVDRKGNIYGLSKTGTLFTIFKQTNAQGKTSYTTKNIGETGITANLLQSMTFDRAEGKLYVAATADNHLYEIDPATAKTTDLGTLPYWTVALDMPYTPSLGTAPDMVQQLTATADPQGALQVDLAWVNPTKSYNKETDIESLQKAEILRNGELIATITDIKPGQPTTYTDKPEANGEYTYTVTVANEVGPSAESDVTVWAGHDVPDAPESATAVLNSYYTLTNDIRWTAPARGAHGGFVDQKSMKYDVIRLNDNKTLAQDITNNSFTDNKLLAETQRYTYKVVAKNADGEGNAAETNYLVNGPARTIPFSADFNSEKEALLWTVIDGNNDGYTFSWHVLQSMEGQGMYVYQQHESYYGFDMLVSPPIEMEEGRTYKITTKVAKGHLPYAQSYRWYSLSGYSTVGVPLTMEDFTFGPNDEGDTFRTDELVVKSEDDGNGITEKYVSFIGMLCNSIYGSDMMMVGMIGMEDITEDTAIDDLSLQAKATAVTLYTIDGRKLATATTASELTNGRKAGIYMLETTANGHKATKKIIIK